MTQEQLSPNLIAAIELEKQHLVLASKKQTARTRLQKLVCERHIETAGTQLNDFEQLVITGIHLGREITNLRSSSSKFNSEIASYQSRFKEHIASVKGYGQDVFDDYQDVRIMLIPETLEFFEEDSVATVHEFPLHKRQAQIAAQKMLSLADVSGAA